MLKAIVIILFTAAFIPGSAYSQQNLPSNSVSGKIVTIDVEGGVINLQTDNGKQVFYLSTESNLFRFTHHIASIEIGQGDPVIIQYTNASGKNIIISLVDNKPDAS